MSTTLLIIAYISSVVKDAPKRPKLDRKDQKLADRIVSLLRQHEEGFVEVFEECSITTSADEDLDESWDPETALDQDEQKFEGIGSPMMVLFGNALVTIENVWKAIRHYSISKTHRNGSTKRRLPSSMYTKFRFLKTENDLRRLVKYEKLGEVKPDKKCVIAFISAKLYEKTLDAIRAGHILHDDTLRSMIAEIKDEFRIDTEFYGSHNWVNAWKRAHRISSRKITTFVSKKKYLEKHLLVEKMEKFVRETKGAFDGYDPLRIYNLDQSGFQKELYTKRTLTETGTQIVEVQTSSAGGITHSYTILPMLRFDGVLHPKLYVVFAESTGSFPTTVPPFNAPNLILAAAKSHIMGKALLADFFKRVVFTDDVEDDVLLVADSWPCWTKKDVIDTVRPANKKVKTCIIPPGATGQIQPLDIGIFRQFKKFMKNLTEYAQRKHNDFAPHQRDSIIKMLSQTYWQLCCPTFQEWRAYAWFAGGYTDTRPPLFEKPTEYCFFGKVYGKCQSSGCCGVSMIRCAYCTKHLCFQDFIINFHRCV